MTRHEFLAQLHELLRPRVYLEIGVQYGTSLALAVHSETAIGVDPEPLIPASGNQQLFQQTSDDFFRGNIGPPVDLAFIDGQHLSEYAWRDFWNVSRIMHPDGVVVFDDVLPRNNVEASRVQCPGDWTGDVWKTARALIWGQRHACRYVDTFPTGLLVVATHGPDPWPVDCLVPQPATFTQDLPVPDDILNRAFAWAPDAALQDIKEWHENRNNRG